MVLWLPTQYLGAYVIKALINNSNILNNIKNTGSELYKTAGYLTTDSGREDCVTLLYQALQFGINTNKKGKLAYDRTFLKLRGCNFSLRQKDRLKQRDGYKFYHNRLNALAPIGIILEAIEKNPLQAGQTIDNTYLEKVFADAVKSMIGTKDAPYGLAEAENACEVYKEKTKTALIKGDIPDYMKYNVLAKTEADRIIDINLALSTHTKKSKFEVVHIQKEMVM